MTIQNLIPITNWEHIPKDVYKSIYKKAVIAAKRRCKTLDVYEDAAQLSMIQWYKAFLKKDVFLDINEDSNGLYSGYYVGSARIEFWIVRVAWRKADDQVSAAFNKKRELPGDDQADIEPEDNSDVIEQLQGLDELLSDCDLNTSLREFIFISFDDCLNSCSEELVRVQPLIGDLQTIHAYNYPSRYYLLGEYLKEQVGRKLTGESKIEHHELCDMFGLVNNSPFSRAKTNYKQMLLQCMKEKIENRDQHIELLA